MRARSIVAVLAVWTSVVACGGGTAADTTATTTPTTTTVVTTTTTTTMPTTTTTTTMPTTTTAPPTATESLAEYLEAVDALMADAETAALMFNFSWQATSTINDETKAAIAALDATPLRDLIPAGLEPDLETAALAVFADLDSMISSLHGAVRFESNEDDLQFCVGNGFTSLERFDANRQAMIDLAATATEPTAAPDSAEAGVLAVRLEAIQSMNWGCDSCGGVAYDEPIPVDWESQTVLDGVGFEASFVDGSWEILIYAC